MTTAQGLGETPSMSPDHIGEAAAGRLARIFNGLGALVRDGKLADALDMAAVCEADMRRRVDHFPDHGNMVGRVVMQPRQQNHIADASKMVGA